jgi:hypothetical protein
MIHSLPTTRNRRPRPALLERAHRFLTARERPEVEAAAERYFVALGYRRRADEDGGAIVFERGRPSASLYASSLRACFTRVELALERGDGTGVATIRHAVQTRGRFVLPRDGRLVEAEARAFEHFLERADLDTEALLETARLSGREASLTSFAIVIGVTAAFVIAFVAYAAGTLFAR